MLLACAVTVGILIKIIKMYHHIYNIFAKQLLAEYVKSQFKVLTLLSLHVKLSMTVV